MDDRLQRALDDDLAPGELTAALAADLKESRALFDGVIGAIPVQPIPDLGAAVLRRIDAAEHRPALRLDGAAGRPRRPSRVAEWLWAPRQLSVSIRPAYALAASLLFATLIGIAGTTLGPGGPAFRIGGSQPAPATGTEVLVHFRLEAPQAQTVTLAGDFSNWSPAHTMQRSADGVWTIVVPLTPGVHEYAFVVDGERWMPDPAAPSKPDGFGGMNSRIAVLRPDARS
jgi:hypothetical protein